MAIHGQGALAAKRAAAEKAIEFVEDGMKLGLGTGSTAEQFIEVLAAAVAKGLDVTCVPTSERTGLMAQQLGVKLTTLDEAGWLDLTIDGADEIDPRLNLIKGGGGALLIEKIVASASDRMLVIADETKQVDALGAFPLPVEVTPFAWETTRAVLEQLVASYDVDATRATLRMNEDEPFQTDEGNLIIDLHLKRIGDPAELSFGLNSIAGVVDNGLFIGLADMALVAKTDGQCVAMMREEMEDDA